MRARRSVLFVPGDSLRKIQKATTLDVDTIVMDLEDGVALAEKETARETVLEALRTLDFGGRERWVRLNDFASGLARDDLEITAAGRPDGFLLPKVGSPDEVRAVDAMLDELEPIRDGAWRPVLGALLETARGVVNAAPIAASSERLVALLFGAEDLAGDVGLTRTREGTEILYARSAVVLAAAAHGLAAIDTLFTDLTDLDGLAADARFGVQLGFAGKMAIHPRQVEVIHRAFAPSSEERDRAERLIAAYAEHQAAGTGAFEFEGKMVDRPMVRAAERVLSRVPAADVERAS